jgi:hypothetical protein
MRELKKELDDLFSWIVLENEIKRHWDSKNWPGQPGSMSRDNFTPPLLASMLYGSPYADLLIWFVIKRFGFMWNRVDIGGNKKPWWHLVDWVGMRNVNSIIRHIAMFDVVFKIVLFPIVTILDLFFLFQCVIQVLRSRKEQPGKWSTSDDKNLCLECLYMDRTFNTPASLLGKMIYRKRLPAGDDFGRYPMKGFGPYSAWVSYFRHEIKAPPLDVHGAKHLKNI